jgi:hypothetical protein
MNYNYNFSNNVQLKNENITPLSYNLGNIENKNPIMNYNYKNNLTGLNLANYSGSPLLNNNIINGNNQNYLRDKDPNKFHIRNLSHNIISHRNDSYFVQRNGDQNKREEYRKENFHRSPNYCKN